MPNLYLSGWVCIWGGCSRSPQLDSLLYCSEHDPLPKPYTSTTAPPLPTKRPKPQRVATPEDPERARLREKFLAEMRGTLHD